MRYIVYESYNRVSKLINIKTYTDYLDNIHIYITQPNKEEIKTKTFPKKE